MHRLLLGLVVALVACGDESISFVRDWGIPVRPLDLSEPIDFGFVPVGAEGRFDLEVVNRSEEESLTVGPSVFEGDFASTIEAPVELEPLAGGEVSFLFAPRSAGFHTTTGNLPPHPGRIQLRGTGVVPTLYCEPLQIDFGTMTIEGMSGPAIAEVHCRNDSPVELELGATVAGLHEELFRALLPDSPTIAPFDEIVVPVEFQPVVPRAQLSATLELQLEHAEPVQVELRACMVPEEGQACPDR